MRDVRSQVSGRVNDPFGLARDSFAWSMQWWDAEAHMVWNPEGAFPGVAARSLHLVPNTAWLAYALLDRGTDTEFAEGVAAIRALAALQYDEPGTVYHGTYRRFLEWPHPPADPVMWEDYDPNWRQFVGTVFALVLEDFSDRLEPETIRVIGRSIRLACEGEPDARIPPGYSNPALMRAWLDAWYGRRAGVDRFLQRGIAFGREIVAEFDVAGAFDEFNSPTYYGIDLYALRCWRRFPPAEWFSREGARLEGALWRRAGEFFHAELRNFCGPYTRSYHPDANRSVALFALWIWAVLGREYAPLPPLDGPVVDHGHDLMCGPLLARLAGDPGADASADFRSFRGPRSVRQELAHGRTATAWLGARLMIGAEAGEADWGGWDQFFPATAHWRAGTDTDAGTAVLWMVDAHRVRAQASERRLTIELPDGPPELRLRLQSPGGAAPTRDGVAVDASGMRLTFTGDAGAITLLEHDADRFEIVVATTTAGAPATIEIGFTEAPVPAAAP